MMMTKSQNGRNGEGSTEEAMALLARDFALHCRRLRVRLKMNQHRFGKLMKVTNQMPEVTVSRWESGAHTPQPRYLVRFMEIQNMYDDSNVGKGK